MAIMLRSLFSAPGGSTGRVVLARTIRAAATALQVLAERVAPQQRAVPATLTLPRLEFHSDAGAPEGALYVDGLLFGHLAGVHRL
jgi:hypothetical protein